MDVACSTYGGRRGVERVLVGNRRVSDTFKDQGIDGSLILKLIFEK